MGAMSIMTVNRPRSHSSARDSLHLAARHHHSPMMRRRNPSSSSPMATAPHERNTSMRIASIASPPTMATLCWNSSPPPLKIGRRGIVALVAPSAIATDSESSSSSQSTEHLSPQKGGEAVVVGAGPAGLAASIMLAKLGWERVVVLERQQEVGAFDPGLGFVYSIDGRGQEALEELSSDVLADLKANSVRAAIGDLVINVISPDGELKPVKPGIGDKDIPNYWLPRHQFVKILLRQVEERWGGTVEIRCGVECDINLDQGGDGISINVKDSGHGGDGTDAADNSETMTPDLLIGADGINSAVREALVATDGPEAFGMNVVHSGSAGMQFKVLNLPGKFQLLPGEDSDGSQHPESISHEFYSYVGASKDPLTSLRLGLLPVYAEQGDDSVPRTANIIRRPEHKIWSVDSGEEMLQYLKEAFPQMPVQEIVSLEEAERFAKARPGRFPAPQHCRSLQKVVSAAGEGKAVAHKGVVLVGDAAHAFPPDLGQGVNSALQDVNVLGAKLKENDKDLGEALTKFEETRLPEVAALITLMKLGFPWQYYQDTVRRNLWTVNFAFRMLLNKVLPAVFAPQISGMIMTPSLSYTEILRRAHRTTAAIWATLAAAVLCAALLFAKQFV